MFPLCRTTKKSVQNVDSHHTASTLFNISILTGQVRVAQITARDMYLFVNNSVSITASAISATRQSRNHTAAAHTKKALAATKDVPQRILTNEQSKQSRPRHAESKSPEVCFEKLTEHRAYNAGLHQIQREDKPHPFFAVNPLEVRKAGVSTAVGAESS